MTITNKFAGTCQTCKNRVEAGAGTATKKGGRWVVLCKKDGGETHGANNPWRDLHMDAEMDFTGGEYSRAMGRRMVNMEYRNTDELAEPCTPECGGTCHWRATVGARQCTTCRSLVIYSTDKVTGERTRRIVPVR